MIPASFRDKILETNSIYKAVAIPQDPHMKILFTVWTTYVNPGGGLEPECTKCLGEILGYYKTLQEYMIEMRRQDQLLNDL